MLGGGINNIDIINASQSEARNKLRRMAGIKDSPSGILASSPELMQAASAMPARPQPMPMPMAQPMPATMPMVQPALPQVAAPTTVAPGPVQQPVQQAPAPRPMAPQPQQPPVMMNEGGFLTRAKDAINAIPGKMAEAGMFRNIDKPQPVDITQDPLAFLKRMDEEMGGAVTEKYGSTEAALKEGRKRANIVESATTATDDPKKITDAVMVAAEVEPTNENKKDFARNVFGLENVNDIDEINRRIADVAISSAIGKGPDEFAQAVLLGLQNYKQTASARAAAKSGGSSGFEPMPRYGEALPNMVKTIMQNDPGVSIEEAMVEARKVLDPLYGRTGGGAPTQQQPQNTEQMPTTPGTRFRDNRTGKIMVVGEDGKPREE